jgi:hypothetical protein
MGGESLTGVLMCLFENVACMKLAQVNEQKGEGEEGQQWENPQQSIKQTSRQGQKRHGEEDSRKVF